MTKQKTAITPTREENYPEWYQQVIKKADMAETSDVHGCMVIKPWGYAIWENIQKALDDKFKAMGVENLYFPLFIPLSYLEKEASHVEGFAKECAVVTHHRLEHNDEGGLRPTSPLEEPLVIRPTSETIIGRSWAKWIQSYRDLPVLMNQWANIVRWEMRTRLFLRTTEFLWQEGHTAHATKEEAVNETLKMLDVYANFAENHMAIPVIKGEKTESEKFPGAETTYCIEAMMQDRKALQSGTSHFLGQNFARAFDITFLNENGTQSYAWTTSWGVSTRLIGGLIMTHSDDDGLVLPPKLSPLHIVILPVTHKYNNPEEITKYCEVLAEELRTIQYHDQPIRVKVDNKDGRPGDKAWGWVKKGVPIRLEIGPKEYEEQTVYMGRRDKPYKDRKGVSKKEFVATASDLLNEMQNSLFARAKNFLEENSKQIKSESDFYDYFNQKENAGFAYAYWAGDDAIEEKIKKEFAVTVRCLPLADKEKTGKCIFTEKDNARLAVFGRSY